MRYAHFATHGYFNDKDLTAERLRLKKALATWTLQMSGSRLGGAGLRNPAVYTGLVFAGVNHPAAGRSGPWPAHRPEHPRSAVGEATAVRPERLRDGPGRVDGGRGRARFAAFVPRGRLSQRDRFAVDM